MINIILSGCMGKMGKVIASAVEQNDEFNICAGVDTMASSASGFSFPVYSNISKVAEKGDVIIDFSRPDALPTLLHYAKANRIPLVLASTGYNKNDKTSIEYAAENIPIMYSSNMSLGVNILKLLSASASASLNSSFDIEIVEKHHSQKVDAPSGTAMMLADAVNEAAGGDLEYIFDRHERSMARPKRELGLHAVRGGSITGDHTVIFAGQDEVIELTHRAYSRNIYAVGALKASAFIVKMPCGLYDMTSLLTQEQIITNAYYSLSDALITVSGIKDATLISRIFKGLKESDIIVDIISQPAPTGGCYTLSLSVLRNYSERAVRVISDLLDGEEIFCADDMAKVMVEGSGMAHHSGAASDVLCTLASNSVPVWLITTSETKITCCVPEQYAQKAVALLKEDKKEI